MTSLPARRPAETAGVALSIAAIVCTRLGLDEGLALDIASLIGFAPAAVTMAVEWWRRRGEDDLDRFIREESARDPAFAEEYRKSARRAALRRAKERAACVVDEEAGR